jgi:hypothetical protein
MAQPLTTTELALIDQVSSAVPENALPHTTIRSALRRCRAAWLRAYSHYMKNSDGDDVDKIYAIKDAARAYCFAMPLLAGPDGIRDFIACTAYGIAIGAIPAERGGQLLYAAQVALNALPRELTPAKSRF